MRIRLWLDVALVSPSLSGGSVRKQLVVHGIAISNMAEQAIKRHWEVSMMMLALSQSVKKKRGYRR